MPPNDTYVRLDTSVRLARQIIAHLGQSGTPPEYGVEWYTVGLDDYLAPIREEYLELMTREGVSSFKLVVGSYGGGKTHFLYCVRDMALHLGYPVIYVPLSPAECPFNQLDLVYRAIMNNIAYPISEDHDLYEAITQRGIESFIRHAAAEVARKLAIRLDDREKELEKVRIFLDGLFGIESSSFARAMREAILAVLKGDEETFNDLIQWLKGERIQSDRLRQRQIVENIDSRSAFRMIRSLAQWIRQFGFHGTVVLFDEAERAISLQATRQVMAALDHLRQWIDECGQGRFPGVFTLYAIPDESMLLDRPGPSYEALRQRLHTVFSKIEPTGVKIYLDRINMEPRAFLISLGKRLLEIYERAYTLNLPREITLRNIEVLADQVYRLRYADISYRRLFVTSIIPLLHRMRHQPDYLLEPDEAEQWVIQRYTSLDTQNIRNSDEHEF